MKKRTIIIVISIFVILAITVTAYVIREGQSNSGRNEEWTKKTINKELMKTDADCGIASVKMLLDFYGMNVSYEELKKETNSTSEGTDWKDIKKYLKTLDNVEMIEFKENTEKARTYLENGYPLFICWDVDGNPEWSHYSILIAIGKYSVWMLDPEENKSLSEYSLDYFLPCWEKEHYWFCVLEENGQITGKQEQITDDEKKSADLKKQIVPDSLVELLSLLDTNIREK